MKKHKKIGVVIALLVIVTLGVTGVFWYKNNVFIGVKDVKAALGDEFVCQAGMGTVSMNADKDNWTVSGPNTKYNVNLYLVRNDVATDIQKQADEAMKANASDTKKVVDVKKIDQWYREHPDAFANGGQPDKTYTSKDGGGELNFTLPQNLKEGDPRYTVVLDLWYEGQEDVKDEKGNVVYDKNNNVVKSNYYCGYRGFSPVTSANAIEINPYKYICENWANSSETQTYEEASDIVLNEKAAQYIEEGVYDDFENFKKNSISEICNDGSSEYHIDNIVKEIKNRENEYDAKRTFYKNTETAPNPELGNKEDYEERQDTDISTLYCKVNSVYLKDVDGDNSLEKSESNKYALNLKGNPSASEATRENSVDISGEAKPNLYLFKHTAEPVTKTYNLVESDGQGGLKEVDADPINACTVNCTEYVKVNFDPPQEVEAGTCFSYAVQVIAFTECKGELLPNSAPPRAYASSLRPRCHDGTAIGAGPNEDFGACIQACDGGKYTEDCSLKCLEDVYGSAFAEVVKESGFTTEDKSVPKELSLHSNKSFVRLTADDNARSLDEDKVPSVNTPESQKESVREFFKTHSSGEFFIDTNTNNITFRSNYAGHYWAQYAPFYYLSDWGWETMWQHDMHWNSGGNKARCSDASQCEPQAASCTTVQGACQEGVGGQNGGGGFLVDVEYQSCNLNSETPYCKNLCDTTCWWDTEDGSNGYMSADMAQKVNDENSRRYQQAIDECTASAACKSSGTPTTSTFYIGVNDKDGKEKTKWDATNSVGNTTAPQHSGTGCIEPGGNNKFIIQGKNSTTNTITDGTGGLCYCGNEDYDEWHHYTRWTFPGRWVDKKSTEVTDQPPKEGAENLYDGGYNKYCIDRKEREDINIDWLKQYLTNKKQYTEDVDARSHITEQNIESWNIFGGTKDFGNYGWNIDFKCFYSLTTKDIPIDPPEDPDDPGDPSPDITTENAKIKAADLKNPIPKKGGTEYKESWNWSDGATKMDVELDEKVGSTSVYEIAPSTYRKYVQDLGDDVFKGNDYLDYQFKFTGSDLKKIADDIKRDNKFGDFSSGEFIPISGYKNDGPNKISAYFSKYIRTTLSKNLKKSPERAAVKCNNLDSRGGNATKCSTTDSDMKNSTTKYTECFKENKRRREADPNAELLECEAEVLE